MSNEKPPSEEEEFRRLAVELRILESTAETIQARINMVNTVLTDLNYANMTLESIEKEEENADLLVPVGGGSYVKAKLQEKNTVLVGMGAGVTVEKTLAQAKETVQNRISQLEKTRASLQQQFTQIIEKIREDKARLEEISAKLSQRRTPQ
ncbi:MAG TPA: prefoldin subunit alpha [Candidatus Bathyarchaeota archaeon]|nr:prefoldin subunit alpha [Candidatus Bathyarchaeota archaeon]